MCGSKLLGSTVILSSMSVVGPASFVNADLVLLSTSVCLHVCGGVMTMPLYLYFEHC